MGKISCAFHLANSFLTCQPFILKPVFATFIKQFDSLNEQEEKIDNTWAIRCVIQWYQNRCRVTTRKKNKIQAKPELSKSYVVKLSFWIEKPNLLGEKMAKINSLLRGEWFRLANVFGILHIHPYTSPFLLSFDASSFSKRQEVCLVACWSSFLLYIFVFFCYLLYQVIFQKIEFRVNQNNLALDTE